MGKYNAIKSLVYKIPCHPKKEEKTNKTIPKKKYSSNVNCLLSPPPQVPSVVKTCDDKKGERKFRGQQQQQPTKKKKSFFQQQQQQKIHKIKKYKTYGVSCFEMIYAHRHLSSAKSPQKRKPVSLFPSRHQSLSFFSFSSQK
jgi:hypothetical protein